MIDQRPKIVMVHGYGGCGMMFYRMVPFLRKYFRLTTIDMLGQGASGSPEFLPKTA